MRRLPILAEEVRLGVLPKEEGARQARTASMGTGQLKGVIKGLKGQRQAALDGKDTASLKATRLQIKRMKRRLRKLREVS